LEGACVGRGFLAGEATVEKLVKTVGGGGGGEKLLDEKAGLEMGFFPFRCGLSFWSLCWT
jgi:hypothetical protein